jgi:pyruvate formate lyase activating enzyme
MISPGAEEKVEAGASATAAAPRGEPHVANKKLARVLDRETTTGKLWRVEEGRVRCVACGHRCLLGEGRRGICKVRFNEGGQLRVPHGYVCGLNSDPVEKKPFFHVHPGSAALTFGMLGCNYHCPFCQNWVSSQALRDAASEAAIRKVTPEQIVGAARGTGARLVVSSYNEPLITAEWAASIFELARPAGLLCGIVSNGHGTPEVLDFLRPWLTVCKVDLKTFNDQHYRRLGGTLRQVTDTIRGVYERGIWLEVLTLIVPGFNNSEAELRAIAQFIASLDRDIPWHVTAFHKDYKMTAPANTTARDLVVAAEIGAREGLHFVYAGNLPGQVGEWESTRCPGCGAVLIKRWGYHIMSYKLTADGRCPRCQRVIPGVWPSAAGDRGSGSNRVSSD